MKSSEGKKFTIIIPAHNEAKHISQVVKHTQKFAEHIIVVNDGSRDETACLARQAGATVISHIVNLGKGAAAKTGCDFAYTQGYEAMVLMDADGQHLPEDIPRFLEALKRKDIVFGYRKTARDAPVLMNLGNWGLTQLSKLLFSMDIYDTQSGYRAFTKRAYRKIRWNARDYAMESEMIFRARGLRHAQIPIKRIYLDTAKGTTIFNGISIGFRMLKWKLFGG